jgi:alcohol dehydrogenase YqhD (iron-dependent ADH family)
MEIEYFGVTHIIFGPGKVSQVGSLAKSFGKKVFVVTGSGSLDAYQVLNPLTEQGI